MKKNIVILLSLLCLNSAYAISDSECREIYNESFEALSSASVDFNEGYLNKVEFAIQVAEISTKTSASRGLCLAVESPDNRKCVATYKKRYKTLRKEIKLTSVLAGNQTEVKPKILRGIANEFSSLINRVKCSDL